MGPFPSRVQRFQLIEAMSGSDFFQGLKDLELTSFEEKL